MEKQKAFDFWLETIKEKEYDAQKYKAGLEWMVNFWQKKLDEFKQ